MAELFRKAGGHEQRQAHGGSVPGALWRLALGAAGLGRAATSSKGMVLKTLRPPERRRIERPRGAHSPGSARKGPGASWGD